MKAPRRKDIRMKSWDYSSRACYHVTICTHGRAPLFGAVVPRPEGAPLDAPPASVSLTAVGRFCESVLDSLSNDGGVSVVEKYVVMPNHVHILVLLNKGEDSKTSLARFVRYFKSQVTKAARANGFGGDLWQKGYYERIVRDEVDFSQVWEYIDNNPAKWVEDDYYVK